MTAFSLTHTQLMQVKGEINLKMPLEGPNLDHGNINKLIKKGKTSTNHRTY